MIKDLLHYSKTRKGLGDKALLLFENRPPPTLETHRFSRCLHYKATRESLGNRRSYFLNKVLRFWEVESGHARTQMNYSSTTAVLVSHDVYFFRGFFVFLLFITCKKKIRLYGHYNAFNFVSVRPSDPWGRALIEFGDEFAPGIFFRL